MYCDDKCIKAGDSVLQIDNAAVNYVLMRAGTEK